MKTIGLTCPQCRATLVDFAPRQDRERFIARCGACHVAFVAQAEVTTRYEACGVPDVDPDPDIYVPELLAVRWGVS